MNKHNHNSTTTEEQHHEEHHSWLHNIIEKMQHLDADFPLSGGEPHPHVHYHAPAAEHTVAEMEQETLVDADHHEDGHKHHTWLGALVDKMQHLDVDFPLSGGDPHHHAH